MEVYEILEKRRDVKLSGTYKIRLLGVDFLPLSIGKNYVSLKTEGTYAEKETPVVIFDKKYLHFIGNEPRKIDGLYAKNPEIGTYETFRIKPNGREVRHEYPYLYLPKITESPKIVDGEIWLVRCWGKCTTYTSGGTNPLYRKDQFVYIREFISKSGSGMHWDKFFIIVTRPNADVRIV